MFIPRLLFPVFPTVRLSPFPFNSRCGEAGNRSHSEPDWLCSVSA